MTGGRIASTKQAAMRLGFVTDDGKPNTRAFLLLRLDPKFPKPLRQAKHHLWWDFAAIERWLDNHAEYKPESTDWSSKIRGRLKNGNIQNEIPRLQA